MRNLNTHKVVTNKSMLKRWYWACVPTPLVVPDGIYVPCKVRILMWLGWFALLGFVFYRVKVAGDK